MLLVGCNFWPNQQVQSITDFVNMGVLQDDLDTGLLFTSPMNASLCVLYQSLLDHGLIHYEGCFKDISTSFSNVNISALSHCL